MLEATVLVDLQNARALHIGKLATEKFCYCSTYGAEILDNG